MFRPICPMNHLFYISWNAFVIRIWVFQSRLQQGDEQTAMTKETINASPSPHWFRLTTDKLTWWSFALHYTNLSTRSVLEHLNNLECNQYSPPYEFSCLPNQIEPNHTTPHQNWTKPNRLLQPHRNGKTKLKLSAVTLCTQHRCIDFNRKFIVCLMRKFN